MATATSTQDWIEELKGISVLELAERIKALEEEFGVSAAAVAAPAAAAAGGGGCDRRGHGGRRYAELLLERFDALGQLEHRDALELLDPVLCLGSHLRQSSLVGFSSAVSD